MPIRTHRLQNLIFRAAFIKMWIESAPVRNENALPNSKSIIPIWDKLAADARPISATITAGMLMRNESFNAASPLNPRIRRAEIVMPEREMPGNADSP